MTEALAAQILEAAKAKGWMIATAESCTGGMISAALTDIPGSSAVFDRGFVTYSYPAKTAMLGVSADILRELGAVSEPVACQMAKAALENSDADISVAVTGVAGPGKDGDKPEGRVWFAIATAGNTTSWVREFGAVGRDRVRTKTVHTALERLLAEISTLEG